MIRASIIALSLLLASCSSVLTATRDTPIEDNHGTRTFGSTIDDPFSARLTLTRVTHAVSRRAGFCCESRSYTLRW